MTEAQLAELEALSLAATPGPWVVAEHMASRVTMVVAEGHPMATGIPHVLEDKSFIAAAREAVPALVAEVRRLKAERNLLARCWDTGDDEATALAIDIMHGDQDD